jgi:hypothetical protein
MLDKRSRNCLVELVTTSAENRCLSFEAIAVALEWSVSATTIRHVLTMKEFSRRVAHVKPSLN